ncbi:MAG: putative anti-sigma regulatory factor, serine/threonine protein kinase [Actinoallomurus sp.]|nr:putative anti-sigma regulatory factor, serine/threonine protein kinase [Actinoallomurus sp.]
MSILSAACPAAPASALRWRRAFPGRPEQASVVRRFVEILLHGCPLIDDVLLVVDELVVNTLRHIRSGQAGGSFAVEVRRVRTEVVVMVTDQGCATEPTPTDADELAESGRGLRTISLLAASWGWHGNAESRTVTAVFATDPPGVVRLPGTGPEDEYPYDRRELRAVAYVADTAGSSR